MKAQGPRKKKARHCLRGLRLLMRLSFYGHSERQEVIRMDPDERILLIELELKKSKHARS